MKIRKPKDIYTAAGILAAFLLWTVCIQLVDVQSIGPKNSAVGLAAINQFIHNFTGVHMSLYIITDWLSLVPLGIVMGFALLGIGQWRTRKHIFKVDRSILLLGGFYAVVLAAYCFFEKNVVNYRPVLIDGQLEASYPSSTTMLVLCVMPTALIQFKMRIRNTATRRCVTFVCITFTAFMVVGRLVSGVHWFSDIVGGILLSAGLVKIYQILMRIS
jgi:undecaprenyl-diphosphatase